MLKENVEVLQSTAIRSPCTELKRTKPKFILYPLKSCYCGEEIFEMNWGDGDGEG